MYSIKDMKCVQCPGVVSLIKYEFVCTSCGLVTETNYLDDTYYGNKSYVDNDSLEYPPVPIPNNRDKRHRLVTQGNSKIARLDKITVANEKIVGWVWKTNIIDEVMLRLGCNDNNVLREVNRIIDAVQQLKTDRANIGNLEGKRSIVAAAYIAAHRTLGREDVSIKLCSEQLLVKPSAIGKHLSWLVEQQLCPQQSISSISDSISNCFINIFKTIINPVPIITSKDKAMLKNYGVDICNKLQSTRSSTPGRYATAIIVHVLVKAGGMGNGNPDWVNQLIKETIRMYANIYNIAESSMRNMLEEIKSLQTP